MDVPSIESAVLPLNEGIVSICDTCKSLLDVQVSPTTSPNYVQIWKHIGHADQCLKKSKTMIEERQKYLEKLIKEKGNAEEQNKVNASDSSEEIQRLRTRQGTGTGVTIGGAVLAAIPVIGWIPGIIMLAVGTSEIVKSQNAIMEVENQKLKKKEIDELKQNLQWTSEIQETVRRAVHLLNIIRGKVTEMERHGQSFIFWEPVMKAMEDVLKAKNPLVYNENISVVVNTLRENVKDNKKYIAIQDKKEKQEGKDEEQNNKKENENDEEQPKEPKKQEQENKNEHGNGKRNENRNENENKNENKKDIVKQDNKEKEEGKDQEQNNKKKNENDEEQPKEPKKQEQENKNEHENGNRKRNENENENKNEHENGNRKRNENENENKKDNVQEIEQEQKKENDTGKENHKEKENDEVKENEKKHENRIEKKKEQKSRKGKKVTCCLRWCPIFGCCALRSTH